MLNATDDAAADLVAFGKGGREIPRPPPVPDPQIRHHRRQHHDRQYRDEFRRLHP